MTGTMKFANRLVDDVGGVALIVVVGVMLGAMVGCACVIYAVEWVHTKGWLGPIVLAPALAYVLRAFLP